MDFTLDEQQTDVRDLVVGVVGRRTSGSVGAAPTGEAWFDRELWRDLGSAGLLGIAVPEERGGSGAGFIEQCLVVEEVARAAARVPVIETAVLAALPVALFGSRDQAERWVVPFCTGEVVLTATSRTEPSPGLALEARRDGDVWRLTGALGHVPLADVAARVLVEVADDAGQRGWMLLDPTSQGVARRPQSSIDRVPRWHLEVDDVTVEPEDVVRAPGDDSGVMARWMADHGVAARCVAQLGSSDAALRMTARHVTEREQFGRPVGTFQAVSHRVADAYIDVTAIRLTTWRAVWLLAQDVSAAEALAIAAWWAADAPTRVGETAMHLHGGLSVDLDYPLHRHYLALKQNELALGGPARRLMALGEIVAVAS